MQGLSKVASDHSTRIPQMEPIRAAMQQKAPRQSVRSARSAFYFGLCSSPDVRAGGGRNALHRRSKHRVRQPRGHCQGRRARRRRRSYRLEIGEGRAFCAGQRRSRRPSVEYPPPGPAPLLRAGDGARGGHREHHPGPPWPPQPHHHRALPHPVQPGRERPRRGAGAAVRGRECFSVTGASHLFYRCSQETRACASGSGTALPTRG
jgi:hypothetical protein